MKYLLAISIGPVQEFIAAARRTRDLWFGSYMLSEISKAAAKAIRDQGGRLVFPQPDTDLSPSKEHINVANVIVAEVDADQPGQVAFQARQGAQNRWLQFAEEAYDLVKGIIRDDIWEDQRDDVIEFYAAWVPLSENYQASRRKLMRLLSGRKNCRDFRPARGREGVPKSSLDGQRESVLRDFNVQPLAQTTRRRLRLREGEQLDVVGVVKRVAGGERPYPSVSRIAADPWVRGNEHKDAFKELYGQCDTLPRDVLHRLDSNRFPQFRNFPFEGSAVYVNRHHEWQEEVGDNLAASIAGIRETLSCLPQPLPYLAILLADGDGMGAVISKLRTADENRAFSAVLARFAADVEKIVAGCNGIVVYAGGDDVLAFVPVDKCLECAQNLHDRFTSCLNQYERPTLSVGIAMAHFLENLEDLLEYARMAERSAKHVLGKNALAVHLYKRGGAPVLSASSWTTQPCERLTRYAELIQTRAIPNKLPYDLSRLLKVYQSNNWRQAAFCQRAIQQDVLRVIADKQPLAGRKYLGEVRQVVSSVQSVTDLERFCEELLIARLLAESFQQAGRQPTSVRP